MSTTGKPVVLVTGASGFIAMHCVLQLLEAGYKIRGTIRSMAREEHLRKIFSEKVQLDDRLEFVQADLMSDKGWQKAVDGCEYVLHLASPFPAEDPDDENELIMPAKEGTLRVLKAAQANGVKRVVLTSSVAAIWVGHSNYNKVFDERDWTNLDGEIGSYSKSKTIAEKAAWDFIKNQTADAPMELAVINPGFVMGPLLDGTHYGTSADTIRKMMTGEYPGSARLMWGIVDVRDVASAHLAAMISSAANGKRYLCVSESIWAREIALLLQRKFASQGYKIPTRQLPDFFIRFYARFDKSVKSVVDDIGREFKFSNQQIKNDLDWQPRSADEAIVAMGESLIQLGVV